MKKFYYFAVAASLLMSACNSPEESLPIYVPSTSKQAASVVEITVLPSFNPNSDVRVRFKPGADVTKFEYAIGSSDDLADFVSGVIATQTVEGNESVDHLFASLEKNSTYMVFARAYVAGSDKPGSVSSAVVRTSEVNITIEESFLGSESAAYSIAPGLEYRSIEYALVDSPDKIGNFSATNTITDIYEPYMATLFDLTPSTEYYLLVRAQNRFGDWSNTLATKITTKAFDEVPGVTITTNHSDFWITDNTFTPNSKTSMFTIVVVEKGALEPDGSIMSTGGYNGNYLSYVAKLAENLAPYSGKPVQYSNDYLTLDVTYEFYIVFYDESIKPVSVVRKTWSVPSFDASAGVAKVGIEVVPSTTGGVYGWTPNEAVSGFFFETFAAELIDGDDPNDPGAKDENWIKAWFIEHKIELMNTYKFNYRYLDEFPNWWDMIYFEESGGGFASGTEFIVYVMPLNKNGIIDGIGEITSLRYRKL